MTQDRYTELFLEEANEHIEILNQSLLLLEREGYNPEVINEIFRTAHTLKSSAAFVGLDYLSSLAHHMEDILQEIKDGNVEVSTELINVLFSCLDRLIKVIGQISEGKESTDTFEDLIGELNQIGSASGKGSSKDTAAKKTATKATATRKQTPTPQRHTPSPQKRTPTPAQSAHRMESDYFAEETGEETADTQFPLPLTHDEEVRLRNLAGPNPVFDGLVSLDIDAPMKNVRFILLLEKLKKTGTLFKSDPDESVLDSDTPYNIMRFVLISGKAREELIGICQIDMVEEVILVDHAELEEEALVGAAMAAGGAVKEKTERPVEETRVQTRNIKVSADKIDYLMNNVGELVITNSGLQKIYEDLFALFDDSQLLSELKSKIDGAARIARDLQSGIMQMRMIPVGLVFHRFTRPIRDLSHEMSKEVELVFQGEDTELDKNIIDALTDPMMHLVRNAIDHGVESPADRLAAGKPRQATLTLNSYQSGNNIFIEVRDDGQGLDVDRILAKARERGLLGEQTPTSEEEILEMIFQPGFSTADRVSDISGRGVGMNVVKNMVQKFNGSVRVQTEPGSGTSFIMSFPLTLAIISAILVRVEDEEYAFPLSEVVENIKISREDINTLEGKDIFNLRGEILPIFSLGRLMGLPQRQHAQEFPVVISSMGNRKIGFIVDTLLGKKEIVIKSLDQNFHTVRGLIGACLMGDGRIVMVLDVQGLLEQAYRISRDAIAPEASLSILNAVLDYNQQVAQLVAVTSGNGKRMGRRGSKMIRREGASSELFTDDERALPDAVQTVNEEPVRIQSRDLEEITTAEHKGDGVVFGETPKPVEVSPQTVQGNVTLFTSPGEKTASTAAEKRKDESAKAAPEETAPAGEDIAGETAEISDESYPRLYEVINTGMVNAGMVLSQLLGTNIDVSIPESMLVNQSELADYLPQDQVISIWLNSEGDLSSVLLLVFDEPNGFHAAGGLMGLAPEEWNDENISVEDLQSVLSELSNIVCSSILNALANKTGLNIMPSVPTFIHGPSGLLLERYKELNRNREEYGIIYISTDFLQENMELLGRLFVFMPRSSLTAVMRKL